jgi:hypothetical protein
MSEGNKPTGNGEIYEVTLQKKTDGTIGVIFNDEGPNAIIVKAVNNPLYVADSKKIQIGDIVNAVNGQPTMGKDSKYLLKELIIPIKPSSNFTMTLTRKGVESIVVPESETANGPKLGESFSNETVVPLPKTGPEIAATEIPTSSESKPTQESGKKYLINDPTLKKNQNVGTIILNNGYSYYGPMDPTIDTTTNPQYELLKISEQFGKILNQKGEGENKFWFNILYDPSNAIMTPNNEWQWTDNYIIKQQYVKDDVYLTQNDDNFIVIFVNDYIYEGPSGEISVDKTVPHYEITLLHLSSKYGQIKNVNGDVIIKPTDAPLLAGVITKTATSATPAASLTQQINWTDIMYDNSNIATATNSIKKLTGIWEWIDYFNNYFSIPGLVMPDPNTEFSELLEQELIRQVDMDNIVFKSDNLEMMKTMLGHEIVVFGQAIIMTLKYIYENNITAYSISDGIKTKNCGIVNGSNSSANNDNDTSKNNTNISTSSDTSSTMNSSMLTTGSSDEQYNAAYKLYEAGKLTECLEILDKILIGKDNKVLANKITLLKELCKLEQKPVLTQEEGKQLLSILENILYSDINYDETLKLACNVYYYLYISSLNKELEDEIKDSDYDDNKVMNSLKPLQINTFANIFEIMNLRDLQDKYRTEYIKQLTAQDKDKYEKDINDTIAAATEAEKASKWTLANILYERAHRYAVVYFGLDDSRFTAKIANQKSDYMKRQSVATNDLTKMIENLYKQLSMEKPQSAFTTFYSEYASQNQKNGFNPNTVKDESKTAIKAILASVSKDETGLDFFKNMNKDIKIEDMNIYDLLLILIKNIILCLNVYLIVISKIYRKEPNAPSIIVSYFQTLNLYYGFKQSYTKLLAAIDSNRTEKGISIEDNPDAIVKNNSAFTNSLLIGLAATLGLSGITLGTAVGGKKRLTRKKSNKRRKNVTKRKYKNRHSNKRGSRKLRRKNSKQTR